MKKSIKKHIEIGTIIKPINLHNFYKVTELLNRKFKCKVVTDDEGTYDWEQEFYYNIDMNVYKMIATNVDANIKEK